MLINIKSQHIVVPNTVGAATTFDNATCVRLVNISSNDGRTVTVASDNSGNTTIGSFALLAGQTEFIEKNPTDVVYVGAGTDVKGAKIAYPVN
jgi:hypothetical protein